MPSSISNSDFPHHRSPSKNWWLVWAITLAVVAMVVAGAENFWRRRGHKPYVANTINKWSSARASVYRGGEKHVVLLGASYIQLGFDTDTFYQRFPNYQLTQLAIDGGACPLPVLADLAEDPDFRGIVVCSLDAYWFPTDKWSTQERYVEYYHRSYSPLSFEDQLSYQIRCRLVTATIPSLRPDNVLQALIAGKGLPAPSYISMNEDRSIDADYTMTDIDETRRQVLLDKRAKNAPKPPQKFPPPSQPIQTKSQSPKPQPKSRQQRPQAKETRHETPDVEKWVRQIKSRGGKVLFVEMPHSDLAIPFAQQRTVEGSAWAQFVRSTSAPVINCRDFSQFDSLKFDDPTHLDFRESAKFTQLLLDLCVEKGIIE